MVAVERYSRVLCCCADLGDGKVRYASVFFLEMLQEHRGRIEALEKKGGEGAQGGQCLPSTGKSGMEEGRMDMDY